LPSYLSEFLNEFQISAETSFLLGFSIGAHQEYQKKFSSFMATLISINNLTRSCLATFKERKEILKMLFKGTNLDQINSQILEIKQKSLSEDPYAYSIGQSAIDNNEKIILDSIFLNKYTILNRI